MFIPFYQEFAQKSLIWLSHFSLDKASEASITNRMFKFLSLKSKTITIIPTYFSITLSSCRGHSSHLCWIPLSTNPNVATTRPSYMLFSVLVISFFPVPGLEHLSIVFVLVNAYFKPTVTPKKSLLFFPQPNMFLLLVFLQTILSLSLLKSSLFTFC